MISSHRTHDGLLNNSIIGPFNQLASNNIDNYVKRQSSNESSLSEEPEKIEKQQNQNNVQQKSYNSPRQLQLPNLENIQCKPKDQKIINMSVNLLKTMKKSQNVERFKSNLFSSAYILKNSQKQLQIFQDDCLLKRKEDCKQQIQKQKGLSILCICKAISNYINIRILQNNYEECLKWFNNFQKKFQLLFTIWEVYSFFSQLLQLWYCPFIISFGRYDHFLQGIEISFIISILVDTLITNLIQLSQTKDQISIDPNINYQNKSFLNVIIQGLLWILVYLELFQIPFAREIIGILLIIMICKSIHAKYESQLEQLYLKGINLNLLDLISLFVTLAYFVHFIACFWHYIGDITQNIYGSWLEQEEIISQNIWVKYNYSFYWSTTTVATVGYGDITPKNQIEIIFSIIVMLLSSCMFAYSINEIGMTVKSINEQKTKYKRNLILLNSYMEKQFVDQSLQHRVRNYFKYNKEKEAQDNNIETSTILKELPISLQNELNLNIRNKISKKIQIFQNNFSDISNGFISKQLIQMKVTPKDIIYHRNDRSDKYLYYIVEGEVNIVEEKSQKIVKMLKPGDTFGEFQFFTGQNTIESAISNSFTELFKIDRDSVLKIIQQNFRDFQRFHKIKDTLLFRQDYTLLKQSCQICNQKNHPSIKCPLIQYNPNSYIKILKNNYSLKNNRSYFQRKIYKFHTLLENDEVQNAALEFQDDKDFTQLYAQSEIGSIKEKNSENNSVKFEDDQMHYQLLKSNLSIKKHMKNSQVRSSQSQAQSTTQINSKKHSIIQNQRKSIYKAQQNSEKYLQLQLLRESYFSYTLDDIDKVQNYTEYFPHNNVQFILKLLILKQLNQNFPQKAQKIRKGRSYCNQ
ncbi:unnamed protein product [Paramecium primaurelia]|uniref:Cyclic nucleotide-binding domain-containing protein n=1 Tax=Paramecium primaurelia TaxID=5886 RepID=A0A8S1JU85_PARPR|nr:unnamed protein product [Paramecium primaurelia]